MTLAIRVFWLALSLTCVQSKASVPLMGREYFRARADQPIEDLRKRAANESWSAILLLGMRNDRASIPVLTRLAGSPALSDAEYERRRFGSNKVPWSRESRRYRAQKAPFETIRSQSSVAARMALARMGVDHYLDGFVAGLSTTSYQWKTQCIDALGYSGNVGVVKYLGPLLSETQPPPTPPGWDEDVAVLPYASSAASALNFLLPDVERTELKRRGLAHQQLGPKEWREWWEQHKDQYK